MQPYNNQHITNDDKTFSLYYNKTKKYRSAVIFYHKDILKRYKESWILKCINSVLNQTYQDFDIFEINYGNKEDFFCKKINVKNYKVTYIKKNFIDHSYCMNYIITKCFEMGYDLVFNTNVDDYYHEERFIKQIECINNGFHVCSTLWYYVRDKNNTDIITKVFEENDLVQRTTDGKYLDLNDVRTQLSVQHNVINHSGVCITKYFWNSTDKYGNLLRYRDDKPYEDMTLWKRAVENKSKITVIKEQLIYYRIHENSICASTTNDRLINNIILQPDLNERRIGLLFVATGKYNNYLINTLQSVKNKFLIEYKRIYFIFTDDLDFYNKFVEKNKNDKNDYIFEKINQSGFPGDTLYRYHYFLRRKSEILQKTDIIYYLDADMDIINDVKEEILPDVTNNKYFIGVRHPGFYMESPFEKKWGAIETRGISTAYVPENDRIDNYIAGGFNGGITYYFIKMCKQICKNIDMDDKNEIVAVWHDESHLNKYLTYNYNKFKILEPKYCYPQGQNINMEQIILALSKDHSLVRYDEKFISCNLQGGLGNQLFQIFTAISTALDNNYKFVFNYLMPKNLKDHASKSYRDSIFRFIRRMELNKKQWNIYNEISFNFNKINIDKNLDNILLNGYFQSYKYFDHNKKKILKYLNMEENKYLKNYNCITKILGENTVAIHVRRGDYLDYPLYHYNLTEIYYKKALRHFNNQKFSFIIFSDDIEYCKNSKIFDKLNKIHFVEEKDTIFNFYLMMFCQNIILSNSSFSWWATYLSNKNKVIAPGNWFGINGPKNIKDLFLPTWIIEYDFDQILKHKYNKNKFIICICSKNNNVNSFTNLWLNRLINNEIDFIIIKLNQNVENIHMKGNHLYINSDNIYSAFEYIYKYFPNMNYIFKINDDCFLNLDNLIRFPYENYDYVTDNSFANNSYFLNKKTLKILIDNKKNIIENRIDSIDSQIFKILKNNDTLSSNISHSKLINYNIKKYCKDNFQKDFHDNIILYN